MKIVKSNHRFLPATVCLALATSTSAIGQATSMAQGSSQISCNEMAVLGAVKAPGRFKVPGRHRILEVLAWAGGPSSLAGRVVRIHHSCNCAPCSESEAKNPKGVEYDLSAILKGRENAAYVEAGDLVIVPEAQWVSVIGNALRQQTFVYREGMTLKRAIALAGGVARSSDLVRVKIHRLGSAGNYSEIIVVDLKAVIQGWSEDPLLRPFDTLEVSDEQGKFLSEGPGKIRPKYYWDPPLFPRKSPNC